jgi:hypothetical protein
MRTRTCQPDNLTTCSPTNIDTVTCLTPDCPADDTEQQQGVVMVTSENDARKLNNLSFLTTFFDVLDNAVNMYCTQNKSACCQLLLPSATSPTGDKFVIASRDGSSVANNFPRFENSEAKVKIIMKTTRSQLNSVCDTARIVRLTRQINQLDTFITNELILTALSANIDAIQQQLNITVKSITVDVNISEVSSTAAQSGFSTTAPATEASDRSVPVSSTAQPSSSLPVAIGAIVGGGALVVVIVSVVTVAVLRRRNSRYNKTSKMSAVQQQQLPSPAVPPLYRSQPIRIEYREPSSNIVNRYRTSIVLAHRYTTHEKCYNYSPYYCPPRHQATNQLFH